MKKDDPKAILLLEWGALPSEPVADLSAVGMQWALPRLFGVEPWFSGWSSYSKKSSLFKWYISAFLVASMINGFLFFIISPIVFSTTSL